MNSTPSYVFPDSQETLATAYGAKFEGIVKQVRNREQEICDQPVTNWQFLLLKPAEKMVTPTGFKSDLDHPH